MTRCFGLEWPARRDQEAVDQICGYGQTAVIGALPDPSSRDLAGSDAGQQEPSETRRAVVARWLRSMHRKTAGIQIATCMWIVQQDVRSRKLPKVKTSPVVSAPIGANPEVASVEIGSERREEEMKQQEELVSEQRRERSHDDHRRKIAPAGLRIARPSARPRASWESSQGCRVRGGSCRARCTRAGRRSDYRAGRANNGIQMMPISRAPGRAEPRQIRS